MSFDISHPEVRAAIEQALAEDIGSGDITTNLCVPAHTRATGRLVAREELTLAGVELLDPIFEKVAERLNLGRCEFSLRCGSGTDLKNGSEIAIVCGPARVLLTAERTALNFLQRLSGVSTVTHAYVDAIKGTHARILDTRKTTPGLRQLEKMAVAAGGATNHRVGLFDAILIKNNHITASGGVSAALERTHGAEVPVEIEVRSKDELEEALAAGARHLLLDNLTPGVAREWVAYIAGRATVELSGGITLETVRAYAESGADFISIGALTHSAPAVDINFGLEMEG
ncbi:MAG: carboxylating nicotinate-nucleotide diphosphorylase [Acidobacteriota bacterium]